MKVTNRTKHARGSPAREVVSDSVRIVFADPRRPEKRDNRGDEHRDGAENGAHRKADDEAEEEWDSQEDRLIPFDGPDRSDLPKHLGRRVHY